MIILFLTYFAFLPTVLALDCTQIPSTDQISGKFVQIPKNAESLPANFSCNYKVTPPKMVYAKITVTNQLKRIDDLITISDDIGLKTNINKNSATFSDYYVFPGTTTNVQVTAGTSDVNSSFLLTISYLSLKTPSEQKMKNNGNLNYFSLDSIRSQPITVSGDEKISLFLALSGHVADVFDNYFIVDGSFDSPKSVHRLADFQTLSFNSTGNSVSFVGLDNTTSFSSIIVTPTSETVGFDKFRGVSVGGRTGTVSVSADGDKKVAVVIVANGAEQLVLTSFDLPEDTSSCKVQAVTGPPNASKKLLIDFISDGFSTPQLFPYSYFSLIVENCKVQFVMSTSLPSGYYTTDSDSSAYIFSPSYFGLDANSNSVFNVTFEYTGVDPKEFIVDLNDVSIDSKSELDIDIYDADLRKTLSTVITGNQAGSRSRAIGTYLNVQMKGTGSTRLRYQLGSSAGRVLDSFPILLVLLLIVISPHE